MGNFKHEKFLLMLGNLANPWNSLLGLPCIWFYISRVVHFNSSMGGFREIELGWNQGTQYLHTLPFHVF